MPEPRGECATYDRRDLRCAASMKQHKGGTTVNCPRCLVLFRTPHIAGVLTSVLVVTTANGYAATDQGQATAFVPEWALQPADPSAFGSTVEAALRWVTTTVHVPCLVSGSGDEAPGRPDLLSQPAKSPALQLPCDVLRGLHGIARGHGYECILSERCCLLLSEQAKNALGFEASGPGGAAVSALSLALATAPLDVAARLANGQAVFMSQLGEEVQAALVRSQILHPIWGKTPSADFPVGLWVRLVPSVDILPSEGVGSSPVALDLSGPLGSDVPGLLTRPSLPLAISLTTATGDVRVLRWGRDDRDDAGDVPEVVVRATAAFQTAWLTTRERLTALNRQNIRLGGFASIGELCKGMGGGTIEAGAFSESVVWSTPCSAPAGWVLEGLAAAVAARIVPSDRGLQLEAADSYDIPEPLRVGFRLAGLPQSSVYMPLVRWALEAPAVTAFQDVSPDLQDVLRPCIAASARPPTVTGSTRVRPRLSVKFGFTPLIVPREEGQAEATVDPVLLGVTRRNDVAQVLAGAKCPYVFIDAFLLAP